LSSLFVRKLRNRNPSQFTTETAGPAATLAATSGTIAMPSAGQAGLPSAPRAAAGPGGHRRPIRALGRGILVALSALLIVGVLAPLAPSPASASTASQRLTALRWAERQAGKWYCFGGTGGCFDCSGLVMSAYRHAGISIPRTTYGMLASPKLHRIAASQRQRGDLAFYGSGHVELVTARGTFGAAAPGTRVGWHHPSGWWHPTMYFRVG
jgi:cell wall-associated NlpC family hydrolase